MIDEPVSEQDLADNKANFIGRLPLNLESNEGVSGSILNMAMYNLGLDYLRNYADIINSVTRPQVQAAARNYLSPITYVLAVARPQDARTGQLIGPYVPDCTIATKKNNGRARSGE